MYNRISLEKWVEQARADSATHLSRQATEIILNAISMTPSFGGHLFLKGGLLMSIRYGSPRTTTDVDFTCDLEPKHDIVEQFKNEVNSLLPSASARLGYTNIKLNVQSLKQRPREFGSRPQSFPALDVKIGYARTGSIEEERLKAGGAYTTISMDISFSEPKCNKEILFFTESDNIILAYSIIDLIAEKFRAQLQQVSRGREQPRRQDIYDIARLTDTHSFSDDQKTALLAALKEKCGARNLFPDVNSLSNPDVKRLAGLEWSTIKQEVGELPAFETCFAKADKLYRSLPWP